MGRGEQGDLGCVLTSGRDGRRWLNLGRRPAAQALAAGCSESARRWGNGAWDADRRHAAPGDGDFLRRAPLPPDWEMASGAWLGRRGHKAAVQRQRG
jgi:hypothetical protein